MNTIKRYDIVAQYMHNQTPENWKKLESFVISQLDFESRLRLSQDNDLQ